MSMEAPLLTSALSGLPPKLRSRSGSRVSLVQPSYEAVFPPLCVVPGRGVSALLLLFGLALALCLTVWREWLEQHGLPTEELLKYVSIPVVSTVFTYCHIWAALYLTFYPLRYMGCLQIPGTNVGCGWQGIIPNKAEKMAITAVDNLLKLCSMQEMLARIDPVIVAEELDPVLHGLLTHIVHAMAAQEIPETWASLPNMVKNEIITKAREDVPPMIEKMLSDVKENIETVFDIKDMVVQAFVRDPGLLDYMFIVTGNKELIFIRDFGATMGLVFGIIQVTLWCFWSAGWMLPTFGFVVGMGTNWIALKMIFEPVEPVHLFGGRLVIQGLFLKRQAEVSAEYSKIFTDNLLSSRNLIPAIVTGRCSDKLFELIHKHVHAYCDSYASMSRPVLWLFNGKGKFEGCKHAIGEHLIRSLSDTMRHAEKYMDSAMDLEQLLCEKISAMSPSDFEQLLHPVFQEDEWKLVLLGGVLGVLVGLCQWWALGS